MVINQTPASPNNYTATITGKTKIVFHWIVGELESSIKTFQNPNLLKKRSAHYSIGSDGQINQFVYEGHIAWHSGNGQMNRESIGIEHAGGQQDPNGQVASDGKKRKVPTQQCLDASVELVTDIVKRHKMGKLVLGVNAFKHSQVAATMCCGFLDVDYIIKKVNENLENTEEDFDYELYKVGNEIFMRVLKGSINENITWERPGRKETVFCNKEVGMDGNSIINNLTPEDQYIYTVNAKGVIKEFDNRTIIPPEKPCLELETQLQAIKLDYKKQEEVLNSIIEENINLETKLKLKEDKIIELEKRLNEITKPGLPIWVRSIYDFLRNGSYGVAGALGAVGGYEMLNQFLNKGEFNTESIGQLIIAFAMAILGYLQELQKQNRKLNEKML